MKVPTLYLTVSNTLRKSLLSQNILYIQYGVEIPSGKVNPHHPIEKLILRTLMAMVTKANTIHKMAYAHIIKPINTPIPCNIFAKEGEIKLNRFADTPS